MKKLINFGGNILGIHTTPNWSQSTMIDKFISKLNQIKKYNPEGFKEFQKDLYVLIVVRVFSEHIRLHFMLYH